MAGVGRRGFAAAARAAMLATNGFGSPDGDNGYDSYNRGYMPQDGRGMDARRANAPRLDINLATRSPSRGMSNLLLLMGWS
jgi:hypothetical protein